MVFRIASQLLLHIETLPKVYLLTRLITCDMTKLKPSCQDILHCRVNKIRSEMACSWMLDYIED